MTDDCLHDALVAAENLGLAMNNPMVGRPCHEFLFLHLMEMDLEEPGNSPTTSEAVLLKILGRLVQENWGRRRGVGDADLPREMVSTLDQIVQAQMKLAEIIMCYERLPRRLRTLNGGISKLMVGGQIKLTDSARGAWDIPADPLRKAFRESSGCHAVEADDEVLESARLLMEMDHMNWGLVNHWVNKCNLLVHSMMPLRREEREFALDYMARIPRGWSPAWFLSAAWEQGGGRSFADVQRILMDILWNTDASNRVREHCSGLLGRYYRASINEFMRRDLRRFVAQNAENEGLLAEVVHHCAWWAQFPPDDGGATAREILPGILMGLPGVVARLSDHVRDKLGITQMSGPGRQ